LFTISSILSFRKRRLAPISSDCGAREAPGFGVLPLPGRNWLSRFFTFLLFVSSLLSPRWFCSIVLGFSVPECFRCALLRPNLVFSSALLASLAVPYASAFCLNFGFSASHDFCHLSCTFRFLPTCNASHSHFCSHSTLRRSLTQDLCKQPTSLYSRFAALPSARLARSLIVPTTLHVSPWLLPISAFPASVT